MALQHSPSIVTTSLTSCIDAGNPRSYSGSGVNWYDVSGSSNNTTIANSPTYSSGVSGYFAFDGVDDYIDGPFVTPNVGAFTTEVVSYWNSLSSQVGVWAYGTGSGLGGGTYIQTWLTTSGIHTDLYSPQIIGGGWRIGSTVPYSFVANTTYFISIVNSGTVWYFYVNGTSIGSYDQSYLSNTGSTRSGPFRDHVQGVGAAGRYSMFKYYNTALTGTQVTQNFNAIRGRYGI